MADRMDHSLGIDVTSFFCDSFAGAKEKRVRDMQLVVNMFFSI